MKTAFRIGISLAAAWALVAPGSYAIFFGAGAHWSAIIDLTVASACIVLWFASLRSIPTVPWAIGILVLLVAAFSGKVYTFRDSGESGPLPFEWLNRYLLQALPLIALSLLHRLYNRSHVSAHVES